MITDRDIAVRAVADSKGPDTPIHEVMTQDVRYCYEDDDTDDVARNMADIQVRRLPVLTREKRLVGHHLAGCHGRVGWIRPGWRGAGGDLAAGRPAQSDRRISDLNWTAARGHDFGPSLGRVLFRNEGVAQAPAPLEIVKSRSHPVCKGKGVSPFMLRSYRTCSGALLVRWAWRHTADDIPIFGSTTRAGRRS